MNWMEQYELMLNSKDYSLKQVSDYVSKFRPKRLYKYTRLGEYWRDLLFNGRVYMQSPYNFNDPFDCINYINHETCKKHFKAEFYKQYTDLASKSNPKTIDIATSKALIEFKNKYRELHRNNIKVCCFSEEKNSMLMWSHYSDSHKGICIEYSLSKLKPYILVGLFPVIYTKKYYDATDCAINYNINLIYSPALYKSIDWQYEKEWRLSVFKESFTDSEYIADFHNSVTAIYLGANFSYNENHELLETEILTWAKEHHVPVFRMICSNSKYELIRKKINI